jgi:hypothetical protein
VMKKIAILSERSSNVNGDSSTTSSSCFDIALVLDMVRSLSRICFLDSGHEITPITRSLI